MFDQDWLHKVLQILTLSLAISLWSPDLSSGILSQSFNQTGKLSHLAVRYCDPARPVEEEERGELLKNLAQSPTGRRLLQDYASIFGSLSTLVIQWDSVSYSQINRTEASRSIASTSSTQQKRSETEVVCIHLAKKLPDIEHIADLAHELTHATRLTGQVLRGESMNASEFVKARIASRGGEADAFGVECVVKHEILGYWDSFCAPYVTRNQEIDHDLVVTDLYSGTLAASLTGESYPVMLAKQFERMSQRRALNGVQK